MAEMNFDKWKLIAGSHSHEVKNYDRLFSVFHTGTEVKRCLLDFYLRDTKVDFLDWLASKNKNFLQFEDVKRARRRSLIITPTDLELNTIDTVLKHNCFELFWDCCLLDTCLEDILNMHKKEIHRIYLNSIKQHDLPFLSHGFTKQQWECLFDRTEFLEEEQEENEGNISACKGITVSSLDSNLNVLILDIVCPLFKAVNSISECQMRISKAAVLDYEMSNQDFDYIWKRIERQILVIGRHCQLYEYFRSCCARIKSTVYNRTLAQDNRKRILEEAFNNPAFINDRAFCNQVQRELEHISLEENLNMARKLCGKDVCVNLHAGQYSRGAYSQSVIEKAENDLQLCKSLCSTQIHSRHQKEQDNKKESEDIEERCNRFNYLKLVQLIYDIAKDVLVDVLKSRLPVTYFGDVLNGMKYRILPLLNDFQRQLLYPDNSKYTGDFTDLDINILYIILRNVNTICPHINGWGNNPNDDDESISANIDRIRMFKNKYVSHYTKCSLNTTEFLTIWGKIRQCIIQIGGTVYAQRIDCLLSSEINPVIENELCTAIVTLKELEKERERENTRLEEMLHDVQDLTMQTRRSLKLTKTPEGLDYMPLKLKLSGENIPSVKDINLSDFTNEDIQINYIEEGSIIIGLDVSPSALKNVGYFLNVIDTLILGLLSKSSTPVTVRAMHVPVMISIEFNSLISKTQTNVQKHKTNQWIARQMQEIDVTYGGSLKKEIDVTYGGSLKKEEAKPLIEMDNENNADESKSAKEAMQSEQETNNQSQTQSKGQIGSNNHMVVCIGIMCNGLYVECILDKRLHTVVCSAQLNPSIFYIDGSTSFSDKTENVNPKVEDCTNETRNFSEFQLIVSVTNVCGRTFDSKDIFEYAVHKGFGLCCRLIMFQNGHHLSNENLKDYMSDCIQKVNASSMYNNKDLQNKYLDTAKAISFEITRRFYINCKAISKLKRIYPAFMCECKEKDGRIQFCSEKLFIVVEVDNYISGLNQSLAGFNIKQQCKSSNLPDESTMMQKVERRYLVENDISVALEHGISAEVAEYIFNNHSNILAIVPSFLRSVNFAYEANHSIMLEKCITFYCKCKGFVPIGEAHFPSNVLGSDGNQLKIDVMEGIFDLAMLKVGDSIQSTEFKGTIGGFLRYYNKDCFLTCAHVVMDVDSLQKMQTQSIHWKDLSMYVINQQGQQMKCGNAIRCFFSSGSGTQPGIDAAIIEFEGSPMMNSLEFVTDSNGTKKSCVHLGLLNGYLNDSCLDYEYLASSNATVVLQAYGTTTKIDGRNVILTKVEDKEIAINSLGQAAAVANGNSIFPVMIVSQAHFHQVKNLLPKSEDIKMYNQLYINIPLVQGDSGTGIYIQNAYPKGCLGMAIAMLNGMSVVTPMKSILSQIN